MYRLRWCILVAFVHIATAIDAVDFWHWWHNNDINVNAYVEGCKFLIPNKKLKLESQLFYYTSCAESNSFGFEFQGLFGHTKSGFGSLLVTNSSSINKKCVKFRDGDKIDRADGWFDDELFLHGIAEVTLTNHENSLVANFLFNQIHGPFIYLTSKGRRKLVHGNFVNGKGYLWEKVGENVEIQLKHVQKPGKLRTRYSVSETHSYSFEDQKGSPKVRKNVVKNPSIFKSSFCFLDVNLKKQTSDLIFHLKDRIFVSGKNVLNNCKNLGVGQLTPKEVISNIEKKLFSLNSDTLWDIVSYEDEIPIEEREKQQIFTDLKKLHKNLYAFKIDGLSYTGRVSAEDFDKKHRPIGYGNIVIETRPDNVRQKYSYIPRFQMFQGFFVEGKFEGPLVIALEDGRFLNTRAKNNVIHSLSVILGHAPNSVPEDELQLTPGKSVPGIGFLGSIRNGKPSGNVWLGLLGGGYLHGKLDSEGGLTGDSVAYIYPDHETVLFGSFENGVMKAAREVEIEDVVCDEENGIPLVKFSLPDERSPFFRFDPASNEAFGRNPHLRDPMEAKQVEVRCSNVPNSGEGVFALKDLDVGDKIAFYSVLRFNEEQLSIYRENCHEDESKSDEERRACSKYTIGFESWKGGKMSVPPHLDSDEFYSATSGRKVNCAIGKDANAVFLEMEHPRFGLILQLEAVKPIERGQEVFVDYGYKEPAVFPDDHLWYFQLKKEYEKNIDHL